MKYKTIWKKWFYIIISINMKKNLSFILVLLSLLFNIQVGFTHDIEHPYHDNEQTEAPKNTEEAAVESVDDKEPSKKKKDLAH